MTSKITTTRTARLMIRDDGITLVTTNQSTREELADAKENVTAISAMNHGKPAPVLVDMRYTQGIDRETRNYYSSQDGLLATKALALLVQSPITQLMANIFISLDQPPVPTRLFTSEDAAVAWLKTYVQDK
jgi:hypothetical protein